MPRPSLPRSSRWRGGALLLAATLLGSCGSPTKNVVVDFPLSVGFQPLEAASLAATPPPAAGNELHPQGLGPIVTASNFNHYGSHARGYLQAPLGKVYKALKVPDASYLHNDSGGTRLDGPPTLDVEPFPISFRVRYSNATIIGDVKFDVTYRGGPLQGTDAIPTVIGERYQKTWGTDHILVMAGSLVATPVAGTNEVTAVEMVAWLQADTQGQAECDGTLTDLFGDLVNVLAVTTWP
jgi:hypothetical protein